MKVIKPSDTRWLAHERCVKAVQMSYTALVVTLDSNYQNFHAPEALGLYKALSKSTTIAANIYWITLYQVAKLSKSLQTKQIDLSMVSALVNAVLLALDDVITPAAYWVLKLLDSKDDLQQATVEIVSADKIHTFQETVGTTYVAFLKGKISSRFGTCDIVSALAIFDPRNIPSTDSSKFPTYGRSQLSFSQPLREKNFPSP